MTLLFAALLALTPVTAEQAKRVYPAIDLSDLTDEQRGNFFDAAADLRNYAGCDSSLALCLDPKIHDPHALRMAALLHQLVKDTLPVGLAVLTIEEYYQSFAPKARLPLHPEECPIEGKGPVTVVEFSDYQCPHCAAALGPLTALVKEGRKGEVRLCSKYFPFVTHPRARIAAVCAEYARSKGKFWEMNAKLFANQEALEDADLKRYAQELGLNGDEMLKEAYAGKFDAAVEKQRREGMAAGVDSTPSLFVDGRPYRMAALPWYLQFTVDDELQWRKEKGWKFTPEPPRPQKKVAKGK
jgi:protein-disulfide isomerase